MQRYLENLLHEVVTPGQHPRIDYRWSGVMGFGRSSRLHTAKVLRLSEDLPVVVEIADVEEKIQALLPWLEEVVTGGLVTLERARVLRYVGQGPGAGPAGGGDAR